MLDDGVCLLCGKPIPSNPATNVVYCSQECANIDSSSSSASASAASSTYPSPFIQPTLAPYPQQYYPYPDADVPPLIHSHHRARPSISSTDSEHDSPFEELLLSSPHTYARRPSATNTRSTIPTVSLLPTTRPNPRSHRHRHSSSSSDYAFNLPDWLANLDVADKHLHHANTSAIVSSSADSSEDESSYPLSRPIAIARSDLFEDRERTLTGLRRRPHPIHSPTSPPVSPSRYNTLSTPTSRSKHRTSLPAYFSKLSAASVSPATLTFADAFAKKLGSTEMQDQTRNEEGGAAGAESRSPTSDPSSGSIATLPAFASLTTGPSTTIPTPRGRGRERHVRPLRAGASRSRSRTRSLSRPHVSCSPSHDKRTSTFRFTPALSQALAESSAPPPVNAFGLGYARSLGERAIRAPDHVAHVHPDVPPAPVEEEEVRGRDRATKPAGRGERIEGEESERGRSRVIVKRGSVGKAGV